MVKPKGDDYIKVLIPMGFGAAILLIMLFAEFSYFGKVGSSEESGFLFMFLVLVFGAALFFIPLLASTNYEDGIGWFAVLIGLIILFSMMVWRFPAAVSEYEIAVSVTMLAIGTLSVLLGCSCSRGYELEVGLWLEIFGGVISIVPIIFYGYLNYVIWNALVMIFIGILVTLAGFFRTT